MSTFAVKAPCGTEKEFDNRPDAEDGRDTHEGLCPECEPGDCEIESGECETVEAEVVETFDDPTGIVVWAKAELPDGQSAEAHGEGWLFESGVDDNEFARYADTRAKNRAISDLTSAGALAVSEMGKE